MIVRTLVGCAIAVAGVLFTSVPAHAQQPLPSPLQLGDTGPRVQRVHDQLQWLGYSLHASNIRDDRVGTSTLDAVNEFREKFGLLPTRTITPRTQQLLTRTAGTVGRLPDACTRPKVAICVDETQRLVRFVRGNDVLLTTDARFGISGEETRKGSFVVERRYRHHYSSAFDSPMPYSLFFSGAQAIHYSPYFKRDGYAGASHGCINLRSRSDARWLYRHAPLGTPVIIYR